MLSGNKDTDFMILEKLTDNELIKVCAVNKYVRSLCSEDNFWMRRFHSANKYNYADALEMKNYLEFSAWKEFYVWMNNFKKNWLSQIEKYPQLLIKSLKKKRYIDEILKLYDDVTFPIWIDRKIFLRELKRKFFINISTEINITMGYEPVYNVEDDETNDVYTILTDMINKTSATIDEELQNKFSSIFSILAEKYESMISPDLL